MRTRIILSGFALTGLIALETGCHRQKGPAPYDASAAAVLILTVDRDSVRLRNRGDVSLAFAMWDSDRLAARNSDRDGCMLNPVEQCPSIPAGASRAYSLGAVIGYSTASRAVTVRYWPASGMAEYPSNVRTVTVLLP